MMRISSKFILAAGAVAAVFAGAGSSQAQQTIRVGWTIPAEESKYWMMRRPAEFPDLGKTYNIEWTQFQGTAPMTQALAAGALDCATQAPLSLSNGVVGGNLEGLHRGTARLRKARRLFGVLGGETGFAHQSDCRSQGQDGRHIGNRRRHPSPVQHASEAERCRPDKGHQAGRSRL